MRETVLFDNRARIVDFPADAQSQYLTSTDRLQRHSAMVWAEHCTECAWPVCYSSCSLYTPRGDLKCRRLRHGIEPIEVRIGNQRLSGMMVSFDKWGKLEAEGKARMVRPVHARRIQILDHIVERLVHALPVSFDIKTRATGRWNRLKRDGFP